MDFGILGSLTANEGGRDVAPRQAKPRALLALFLLHSNERLTTDRIIDALWGEEPPPTADKALQGHVSTLRKLLGVSRIRTEAGAYRLELASGELDRDRFTEQVSAARSVADAHDRATLLRAALALWRGDALADLAGERFAGPEIAHLDALRLAALEDRVDADLELGRHAELVPELLSLVERHPLSEGIRARLMLALYRSARQAEALRVYREGRRMLAEELGIEPGSELQRLERRILDQDPSLVLRLPDRPRAVAPRQERKMVTLLVVDVTSDHPLDPEDLEGRVGPALARARAIVERHGGVAEPLFANGLLGIFGAPRAHDDDAVRAVRAALELTAAPPTDDLAVRGGIDTGTALVTVDGRRVSVTGEVLSTASRLQLAAARGTIGVGAATRRLTESQFLYAEAGPGSSIAVGRREPGAAPLPRAPLVGRADELNLLERVYGRARDERSVQLVTVVGEPGGGKSRLLQELRSRLADLPSAPSWLGGNCLPYGEGVTYWALGEVVKARVGILESDAADVSAAKIAEVVRDLESDEGQRAWLERGLRALVGIEQTAASGDREQAFTVWRQFLEILAAEGSLVVAFEDIHWADEAFLAFVDHLAARATGVPLMVVCTSRPELLEGHPAWGGGKRNATTIALEPLNMIETEELLRTLLGRTPAPELVKRAGGNPLFAHELASVVDASSRDVAAVPDSLQAVIAAHLDVLAPELKSVAADAAVVGEVFWPGAVASIAGIDEHEVESRMLRLVAHDVARRKRPSSVAQQSEYSFLHVLVRDVAYGQIPRRERVAKHRSVGDWIERLAGDRVTNHAELIAHHFVEALDLATALGEEDDVRGLRPRARTYLTLAGEGARTVDIAQAESFYRRALELTDDDDPGHGLLLGRLAEVADLTGRLLDAEQLGEQAVAALERNRDLLGAGEALVNLAGTLWRLGRPEEERRRVAAAAVRTLEQLPPGPALVRAYSRMAAHELHAGRADVCGEWSTKALDIAVTLAVPALTVQPLHHLGIARFESGDDAGIEDIRAAVRIALEAGLTWETATAQSNLAATIWVTEGPVAALALKNAAREFAVSRGLGSMERTIRAEALWQQFDGGLWDEALSSADGLLSSDDDGLSSRAATMARTVKARILAERGRTREATELETLYLPRARELRDPQDLGPALAAGAALRQARGDIAGAAALIAELEEITRDRDPSQRVHELPHAARVCLAAGTVDIVQALIPETGAPTYTRARLCLASAGATLAEGRGESARAAELYAAAADGWGAFGAPAEEAHALIGQARCASAAQLDTDVAPILDRARGIGERLGAVLILADADRAAADRDVASVP